MWTVDLLTSLSAATLSVWLVHHGGHVTPSEAGRGPAAHHQPDLVAPEPESEPGGLLCSLPVFLSGKRTNEQPSGKDIKCKIQNSSSRLENIN